MAHSAHKDEYYITEHLEADAVLDKHTDELLKLWKESKHIVVFTGAGISTSAGIPDFRGPQGVWTLAAAGKLRTGPTTPVLKAMPTPTHMSLVELQNQNQIQYIISQNVDGLHRRSGILPNKLSELHGNTNLETCSKCGKEYLRDFSCRRAASVHDHKTGRLCTAPKCGGELYDSIINFGENLPTYPLEQAVKHSKKADLMLVLGSSLTVSPACDMPKKTKKHGGKVVICNLQHTPLDDIADLRIYAKCDDLMKMLMKKLNLEIPTFILHRRLVIEVSEHKKSHLIKIEGLDVDNTPASIFKGVELIIPGKEKNEAIIEEPFVFTVTDPQLTKVELRTHFRGNYNEPPLVFGVSLSPGNWTQSHKIAYKTFYDMYYNPLTGIWKVVNLDDKDVNIDTLLADLKKVKIDTKEKK